MLLGEVTYRETPFLKDKEPVLWSVVQLRPKWELGRSLMNPDYNDPEETEWMIPLQGVANSENKDGGLQCSLLGFLLRWALKLCPVQSDVSHGHENCSLPPRTAE